MFEIGLQQATLQAAKPIGHVGMQVVRSIQSVMDDMKAKHDSAVRQATSARGKGQHAQSNIDLLKAAQRSKFEEIMNACRCACLRWLLGMQSRCGSCI